MQETNLEITWSIKLFTATTKDGMKKTLIQIPLSSLPLTIVGLDSRFEYDLNRDPESCVYKDAWENQYGRSHFQKL